MQFAQGDCIEKYLVYLGQLFNLYIVKLPDIFDYKSS